MEPGTAQTPSENFSSDLRDYSGTVLDVQESVYAFLFKRHPLHTFFMFVLPICASVGIGYLEFLSAGIIFADKDSAQGAIVILILPLIIPLVSYWRVKSRMEKVFYTELALSLGCSYSPDGYEPTSGQLFTYGYGHNISNVLTGTYHNQPYRLYDYSYITGSGKNKETHYYTVGELETNATLPHVLGTPTHWYNFISSWQPAGTEPLTLEGNFNEKFKVYVAKDAQVESRQVLEPNVMEKLMNGYDNYSFECVGPNVFLFIKGTMAETRGAVTGVFTLLQRFSDVLQPELQSFENKNT